MMRVITVTGDPGAGKSTIVGALSGVLGAPVWSAGEVARKVAPSLIAAGEWGPEEKLTESLMESLRNAAEAGMEYIILDGWPRKPRQAYELPGRLALTGAEWHSAVIMRISAEEAIRRYNCAGKILVCADCGTPLSAGRLKCPTCGGTSTKDLEAWYNERRGRQWVSLEPTFSALEEMARHGIITNLIKQGQE